MERFRFSMNHGGLIVACLLPLIRPWHEAAIIEESHRINRLEDK